MTGATTMMTDDDYATWAVNSLLESGRDDLVADLAADLGADLAAAR